MLEPIAQILLIGSNAADFRRFEAMIATFHNMPGQLTWCESLQEGHEAIRSGQYDVILLDCQHQPEPVLELLQQVVEQGVSQPVITLTRHVNSQHSRRSLQYGAADYLAVENLDSYLFERCLRYTCDRREIDRKLTQLNLYDPLTGVPNRILFRQTLEQALVRAETRQQSLALLLINLDGFKKVNDSYGSEAGDQLVAIMAQRLGRCVRKNDGVSRIGGDEFTLLLDDFQDKDDVAMVATKVIDVLSAPFTVFDHPLMVSCSIGIAMYPQAGDSVDGLLKCANMAMLQAKNQQGSQYCFYNEATSASVVQRSNLEAELRHALRSNQFEMYYQPRVALHTGETVGMEALIRWRHPVRGLIPPNDFIPIAEKNGLILPIGYWGIQQACMDMMRFDQSGHPGMDIAVNLSFKQLQDAMFVKTVSRIIEQSGIDTRRLEFELTETAIMSSYQQTYESMMALSKLGVTFSLDDFGTGFSSFAHIQRLPISALKIDRSFVRDVVSNSDDAIIVKAMINLAHSLRLEVIAEGVETQDQLQFLRQNDCDQVQGFYYSPAVPLDEFTQLLDQCSAS